MPCLGCLIYQKRCFLIVQLNLSLILFQLDLVHILNLVQARVIDQVFDSTALDTTFKPQGIGVDRFLVNSMLALRCVEIDASKGAYASFFSFFEVKFNAAHKTLPTALDLASGNFDLVAHTVDLARFYKLIAVSFPHQLFGALGIEVDAAVLIALLHCEVKFAILSDLGELSPDVIIFLISRVCSSLKHLPPIPDFADMHEPLNRIQLRR